MNNKHYLGKQVSSFEEYETLGPITGVTLLADDENAIIAGNDSGYMLEMECPYATQAMANNILAALRGETYKGYRAGDAPLDMTAELGDGITVNGLYSLLAYRNLTFGPGHMSEIAAPGESELEHEYPYISSTQRELNRKIATTRSMITKTAEEIRLEIQNEVDGLSSSITQTANSLSARITSTDGRVASLDADLDKIATRVTNAEGNLSTIEQYAKGITLSVQSNSDTSSTISLTSGGTQISSAEIKFTGVVTFNDLKNTTTTIINGGAIQAETVTASQIKADAITLDKLDLDDTLKVLTFLFPEGVWPPVPSGGYIASSLYFTTDNFKEVYANGLYGKSSSDSFGNVPIGFYDSDNDRHINGTLTSSNDSIKLRSSSNAGIEFSTQNADIFLEASAGALPACSIQLVKNNKGIKIEGNLYPGSSAAYNLGATINGNIYYWEDAYIKNYPSTSSDLNRKTQIIRGLENYDEFFDKLQPISFILKDGTSGRRHLGFGAQDVEFALAECGLTNMDFGGVVKSVSADGDASYALRYGEFIPILAWQIQQLKKRVNELEKIMI